MIDRERTVQQLDPLTALACWPVTPGLSAVAITYAIASTAWNRTAIDSWPLAFAALGLLVAAGVVATLAARPGQAPLSRTSHLLTVGLAVAGSVTFSASVWGHDPQVQDDWGQIAIGLLIMTMAFYRPVAEIAVTAAVAAGIVGIVAVLPVHTYSLTVNAAIPGLVAATPIVALAAGSASLARVIVRAVDAWQKRADGAIARLEHEEHDAAIRSLYQRQVTMLNAEAVPFLVDVLERGRLTAADTARAAEIASTLRRKAVSVLDRGWLEDAVLRITTAGNAGDSSDAVRDAARRSEQLCPEQRAAISAFLTALIRLPGYREGSLGVTVAQAGPAELTVTARVSGAAAVARGTLRPFFSAIRVVSRDARLRCEAGTVSLELRYE